MVCKWFNLYPTPQWSLNVSKSHVEYRCCAEQKVEYIIWLCIISIMMISFLSILIPSAVVIIVLCQPEHIKIYIHYSLIIFLLHISSSSLFIILTLFDLREVNHGSPCFVHRRKTTKMVFTKQLYWQILWTTCFKW